MFRPNSLFYADGYKVGHQRMLAPNTSRLYGTWIPRSVKHAPKGITKIVSFGQALTVRWIHDEFTENFFKLPHDEAMKFATDMSKYLMLPFDGTHFGALHKLGYLPIKIKSLPEGIETNPNVPHMTFINTVDGFGWLTLFLETILSSLAWKPATSATIALHYKRNLVKWVMKTDPENAWLIPYLCHDFSARGLSPWDMLSSGLGHATSFRGSDTLIVIPAARYFYGESDNDVAINSVNASEHSVSTTKIFTVGEQQMISDWLVLFPQGILSIVADTFDLWKLTTEYLPAIKEAIMLRDGKLVIRPDSGDPVDILCGTLNDAVELGSYVIDMETLKKYAANYILDAVREDTPHGERGVDKHTMRFKFDSKYYDITVDNISWNRHDKQFYFIDMWDEPNVTISEVEITPAMIGVIELLWNIFGGTTNASGYKVLDPHIGAIYGDSITTVRQIQIYERLAAKGFASTNIVLGIGSYTYQYNTRDTFGFAAKGAWFETLIDGVRKSYNIYKDPITDDGTKKSLKGMIAVTSLHEVVEECSPEQEAQGILQVIYEDGKFYNEDTLTEIRARIDLLVETKEIA
jgi:nicotinamide phosphoribosyltransferase